MTEGAAYHRFNAAFIVSCKHTSALHATCTVSRGFLFFSNYAKHPVCHCKAQLSQNYTVSILHAKHCSVSYKPHVTVTAHHHHGHRDPVIHPKDVQKTCSKWMLRKFWKLQVVDLNQTSRRLHKYLNMFETIITQEIPLKKCQPLFFLVLVKRTQDSILNGQNYDCRDITKLWNSLDVDCTIWTAVNDVTM